MFTLWKGEHLTTRRAEDDWSGSAVAAVTRAPTARETSDAAVIERSWREPECFADLFDRYYGQVHRFAARRLGGSLADDVTAETFLVAFARRQQFDISRPDARPWLFGIASNMVARHHRAEIRRYRMLSRAGFAEVSEGHADQVVARLDARALRGPLAAALAGISDADRDVLLLVAWAELTSEEAGAALGIPAGTARSRLHRARKKIQAALAQAR